MFGAKGEFRAAGFGTGSAGDDWFFLDFGNDKATDLRDEVFASELDWITNEL